MSINSVGSRTAAQPIQRPPEAAEAVKGGRDNDGDADDAGAQSVKPSPAPTVNTEGQSIGKTISVTA